MSEALGTTHGKGMTPAEYEEHAIINGVHAKKVFVVGTDGNQVNPSTEDTLLQLNNAIAAIRSVIGTAADLRVTLLSGTVSTVTTVTGITNLGGNPALQIVPNLANMTYLLANQENISLV